MVDFSVRFDPNAKRLDLVAAGEIAQGLDTDGGLETAYLASLFTWARASEDDQLPDFTNDLKGYWGDAYPPIEGRAVGSLLWLLARAIITDETIERARQYALNCVAWAVQDGIVLENQVTLSRTDVNRVDLFIEARRPDGRLFRMNYENLFSVLGTV